MFLHPYGAHFLHMCIGDWAQHITMDVPSPNAIPQVSGHDVGQSSSSMAQSSVAGQATLCPHQGVVVIDQIGTSSWTVTHLQTYEHLQAQGNLCELHFDEEGFGFVVSDLPDVEPLILEEAFRFRLYSGPGGELLIGGAAGPQVVNLDEFKGKYVAMSLKLHVGCSHSLKEFDAVEFRWIRSPAAKVMWCCKSLYRNLGFTQFNGESWRWISGSWRRWQSLMCSLGYSEHVLPSTLMKELACCCDALDRAPTLHSCSVTTRKNPLQSPAFTEYR